MVIELEKSFFQQKEIIKNIVKEVIQENHLEISETIIDNLVIHLSLCISRELNNNYIPTSESQIHKLKEHEYYQISKIIVKKLNEKFGTDIDKNESYYITMYLANMNLLDMDFNFQFDLNDEVLEDIINQTILSINKQLNIDLKKNDDFYTGMTLHFYPALERLQNNQQLTDNPLVNQIKSQHSQEYQYALIFNSIVEKYYNKSFNEHELSYIALHFGTVFSY